MEKLPQRLVNVRVRDRDALEHAADVREAIEREHKRSGGARTGARAPLGHGAARTGHGGGSDCR